MPTWRVNNATALGGEVCAPWQPGHAYALGARVVCRVAYGTTAARAFVYECTTAGTSHGTTEPTWPTSGTVNDNDVVWTTQSPNDGDWNNASCILAYILNHTAIAAGDFVYVDDGHSEQSNIVSMRLIGSATANNPIKVICVNKADDSLSTGALITHTAVNSVYLQGYLYMYGVQIYHNGGHRIYFGNDTGCVVLEGGGTTVLKLGSSANNRIYLSAVGCPAIIINGNIDFGNENSDLYPQGGYFHWKGGTLIDSGGSGVNEIFNLSNVGAHCSVLEDVDLSAGGNGANARYLADFRQQCALNLQLIRCKLASAAGWTYYNPSYYPPFPNANKFILHHCSSANKYYDFHEGSSGGNIDDETIIVRTGGASDGTTPHSFKMVSSANTKEFFSSLESPPITIWNSAASEKTFTVECVWDSATNIQDDEIWMELEYPADNSSGLGAVAKDRCAILGTPADQAASTVTWSGTDGFSDENKFKLSVTATPGKAGPVTARVYLAKASTTIYVDPKIEVGETD